ncbi:ArsR/SmtB family transcription factor [Rhodococcus wratislaviensis]|uniref:ArsR/SmtB family transcription factor n=1 Tax=Rhodococcus wratislaviensis TaxID=44752 RepID=UPI0035143ECF
MSQSNASQHLTILRERGIVTTRRVKNNVFYSLRSQKIVQAVDLLREFLAEDLADHAALDGAIRG